MRRDLAIIALAAVGAVASAGNPPDAQATTVGGGQTSPDAAVTAEYDGGIITARSVRARWRELRAKYATVDGGAAEEAELDDIGKQIDALERNVDHGPPAERTERPGLGAGWVMLVISLALALLISRRGKRERGKRRS